MAFELAEAGREVEALSTKAYQAIVRVKNDGNSC
jgi:hypothetical protein